MKISAFIYPVVNFMLCRDSFDCPKNHFCVQAFMVNFCKPAQPVYRPSYVTVPARRTPK